MKKLFIYLITLMLAGIKPVLAAVSGPGGSFSLDSVFNLLQNVLSNVSGLFSFGWLNGNELGFLKFMLWLLIFIVFFTVGQIVFAKFAGSGSSPRKLR